MRDFNGPQAISMLPPGVKATVVTVGTFDGVHLGHLDVLNRLRERSNAVGMPSGVVSFHPHPLEIVNPAAAPLLLTVGHEKLELLANAGINYLLVLPFTDALRRFSAEEFVDTITVTAPYDVASGDGLLVGSIFGVAAGEAASGATVEAALVGIFDLKKVASQAWSAGDKVYWDNTNKEATKTATANTLIGVAVEAVAGGAGDVIGRVRLNGSF